MNKQIRYILGITMMALLPATAMFAAEAEAEVVDIAMEQDIQPVTISVSGKTLTIKNAENTTLSVYSITGEEVYTIRIDSPSKIVELNHLKSGCYIIKAGKTARKVYLK
ncbi:MAG: T9SS type A sorting domain-containing protein [Bacteroidaceae bacterium]|nr:T9SS type A sorting domain-containing protein [Bacteroidaceae bacterium]